MQVYNANLMNNNFIIDSWKILFINYEKRRPLVPPSNTSWGLDIFTNVRAFITSERDSSNHDSIVRVINFALPKCN